MKTKVFTFFITLLCSLFFFIQQSAAQCHPDDYTALRALYMATDGDNWTYNTGWDVSSATPPAGCDICSWYGVTCENGRVTELDFGDNSSHNLVGTLPMELFDLNNLKSLSFRNNDLSGSIPNEIGNLSNLTFLELTGNNFSGSIPKELGNLMNLKYLYLWSNQLSGSIPKELGNLSNLKELDLRVNNLSGNLPIELGNLTNLESLALSSNQLSGSIPEELGSLSNLELLYLGNNQLTGNIPAELGSLIKLRVLVLWNNNLSGSIPSELGNLINLIQLALSNNQLDGCIPNSFNIFCEDLVVTIDNNPNLSEQDFAAFCNSNSGVCTLDCSESAFASLMALYNATNGFNWADNTNWGEDCDICDWYGVTCFNGQIIGLNLTNNQLAGIIPSSLGSINSLKILSLGINELTGSIPPELGSLSNLESLSLGKNQLIGEIPKELGNLTSLTSLDLPFNNLTGSIPPELGNLNDLTLLLLSNNQLTGSIPSSLGNLDKLTTLFITDNQLTGQIPAELGDLTSLTWLDLKRNQLSGCIPTSFNNLCSQTVELTDNPNLEEQNFSDFCDSNSGACSGNEPCHPDYQALIAIYNATNGTNWTNNTNWNEDCDVCNWYGVTCVNGRVTELGLGANNLDGVLPAALGDLEKLTRLNLSQIYSIGPIPPEIGNLINLETLYLDNNDFQNPLPSTIGNLTNLRVLFCSAARFTGSLPEEIGNLTNLNWLILDNNWFTGSIPTTLGNLTNITNMNLAYSGFTGTIPEELGNLASLTTLDLDGNQLEGCIPSSFSSLCGQEVDLRSNPNLDEQEFTAFCNSNSGVCSDNEPCHPDYPALMALYNATDGANWTDNTNWAVNCDVCTWNGVLCLNNRVAALFLNNNQLNGNIPPEFGQLSELIDLDLRGNNLTGSIPPEIGQLTNLESISLYNNSISGSIPMEIGNLTNLRLLKLDFNDLTGSIPTQIGSLSNLWFLDLSHNELTGSIPGTLGNLNNLITLDLTSNMHSGEIPIELGNLSELRVLLLGDNTLQGNIPEEFGSLQLGQNLSSVNIGMFTDTYLDLTTNQLSGCIPSSLMSLCGVSVNLLGNSGLEEENFSSFCTSNSGECSDEPCHPDYPALMALYNSTDGANWTDNTNWEEDCDVCNWYGITCENNRVTKIELGLNNLQGPIPPEIGNLTELTILNLQLNDELTGTIPIEVTSLVNLVELELSGQQLSGSIPPEIGNLTELTLLSLGFNLSGSIPSEIGNLTKLKFLSLGINKLTGTIPPEIGHLTDLEQLSFVNNQLTGSIPSEIGNLTKLWILDLGFNQFSGSIPLTFKNLGALGGLYLNVNQLSGNILPDLGNLPSLNILDLSYNQFTGCIPSELNSLCGNNNIVNLNNNPNLSEQDFMEFCNNDAEECQIMWEDLFTNVNTFWTGGAAGVIKINDDNVVPIMAATNCNGIETPIFAVAKEHGLGRVIGMAHEGPITNDRINTFDNLNFFKNAFRLLNTRNKVVGITPGFANSTNISTLTAELELEGFTFVELNTPLNDNQLSDVDIVFSGVDWRNQATVDQTEVDLLASFVNDGGGLFLMGVGWSWPNDLSAFPPNRLASAFGFEFLSGNIIEPDNTHEDWPYFVNFYPINNWEGICNPSTECDNPDYVPLMALYNSTNGNYWSNNNNWGTNCEVCTWEGITCNDAGRVSIITLPNNRLRGYLPSELGQLTELEELFLDGNNLYGIIPEELYTIPLLENIILSNNSLEGGISSSICQLSNLNEIRLANNYLSGEIPSCLDAFTNLSVIDIQNNLIYGCYPNNWINYCGNDQMHFEGNSCLRIWTEFCDTNGDCNGDVYFSHSAIPALMALYDATDGPNWTNNTDWGNTCDPCTWYGVECDYNGKVSGLHLDNNNLSGGLPEEIGLLTDLRVLRLANNQLSGNIPVEIGSLVDMFWIELYNNNFSGTFPDIFDAWNQLHDIRIGGNNFEGPLPYSLGFKTSLRVALFENNNFSGCFPFSYKNLCTNKAIIFESGFYFGGNPQLPNGGDFDAFCSSEAGLCEEEIGCDWVALEIHTGTQALDLFYQFVSFDEDFHFNSYIQGAYNFGTNSPNATLEYFFPLPSGTNDFFIANWAGNQIEYFQLRNLETGEILVENQSYHSNSFTICSTIEECPEEIINDLDFISGTATVRAKNIYASHVTHSGADLTYKAETTITLQPGFEVQAGATFLATIEDCPSTVQAVAEPKLDILTTSVANSNMTIYPNPFTDQTTIAYSLSEEKQISLFVVDILGKPVKNLINNQWMSTGGHQLIFERERLPRGTYFVVLKSEKGYESQKLLLLD